MDLTQTFYIGDDWMVEPIDGMISRGGDKTHLEPRVMDLLICLASKPGEVVSREELENSVWPGMVVGYDALASAIIKLRKAFDDDSKHPQIIQTVPKRGYKLIATVTSTVSSTVNSKPEKYKQADNRKYRVYAALVAGVLVFLLISAIILKVQKPTDAQPDIKAASEIPLVIVLPFANLSNDPEQEYFSDGITDDLITDLSRISKLQLMARNTSFRYKGQTVKPEDIAKELGVQYILEGSVRKSGDQLRINVQLVNTHNGYPVWSERYDRRLDEMFAVQDEVTRSIVNALAVKLTSQEETSLARISTNNFAAYEHFLLGQKYGRERTRESFYRAVTEFEQAIRLDPSYARSYGALAVIYMRLVTNGFTDSPDYYRERALELAKKGVALNDTLPHTYWSLGFVQLYRNEFKQAAEMVEQSVKIAPNYADGYGLLALIHNRLGNADQAIYFITKGLKLNPHYTWDYPYNLGRAYYYKGQYKEAIEELRRALARNVNAMQPRLFLAASYSGAGMPEDAEWEVEQILTINPDMSISLITKTSGVANPEKMKIYLSHLRMAGMPE